MSPNKILPGFPYTLSYFITDHLDSATYYVRAVVYDALTGEVLDTQNLDRQTTNTRLFAKRAQSPGDPSGQGRKIIVIATAYTDSGYTIKSENYQEQSEVYIVQKELGVGGGGNGGSFGPDYGKIREIMQEEIEKVEKKRKAAEEEDAKDDTKQKAPKIKFPDMPFDSIFGALGAIQREVNRVPKELVDLTPFRDGMFALMQAIESKEVTPATDLFPLREQIDALIASISASQAQNKADIATELASLKASLPAIVQAAAEVAVSQAKITLELPSQASARATIEKPQAKEEPMPTPFDISRVLGPKQ